MSFVVHEDDCLSDVTFIINFLQSLYLFVFLYVQRELDDLLESQLLLVDLDFVSIGD